MAAVFAVCVCVLLLPAASGLQSEDRECAFTDHLQGAELHIGPANELRENGTIRCSRGSRCYGLWEKRAGEMHLVKQGCWTHIGDQQECHGDHCLVMAMPSQLQNGSYRFCCCSRDLCNANFTEAPPTEDTPALKPMKGDGRDGRQTGGQALSREETALVALVTVAIAAILIVALFLGYRMMKGKRFHAALDLAEAGNAESAVDLDNLKLLELIGRGRYGTVFRGRLSSGGCVAVKVFAAANRRNFSNECSIYLLPLLQQHDSIARFLGAHERSAADGQPELLILMEYYPQGSLSRYLASHAVDWLTCCRMSHGVTRGLAFLHTEIYRGGQCKPAVAHRDVTSRNVLVRADLSCVLADFGLSMKLTGNPACRHGDDDTSMTISEVGTTRYMAPEVLGGALNLRDCESALKQVDVYALGLLYWETFRRCSDLFPGGAAADFQLAFQVELGNHPSFEQMQTLVSREKRRPCFPEAWKENSLVLHFLKETMEDCWDQDAEARLTAQCAEERLCELMLLSTQPAAHNHRNLSHGWWSPQGGSASSYIDELQVGVVKNLQADLSSAGLERNRNSINSERQQVKSRGSAPDSTHSSLIQLEHTGGLGSGVQVCLQLTEEDLEAKLHLQEVDKNLKDSSDENLMERSLKQFSATQPEAPPTFIQPLRKQQNVPQRPTSLHLLPHASPSPRVLLKLKSNCRQVETGVAKMNTVSAAAEPHVVTTVTNNTRGGHAFSAPAATCMADGATGCQTNPAGPQLEEEPGRGSGVLLLNFSPDEHEPLLRREQPPAESPPPRHQAGQSSNSNNNNNRSASGSEVRPGIILAGGTRAQPHPAPADRMPAPEVRGQRSDPGLQKPELTSGPNQSPASASGSTQDPPASCPPTRSTTDPESQRPDQDGSASQSPDPDLSAPTGVQVDQTSTRRPQRPCSLDLTLSGPFSDDPSLSASGEKIKRRVRTPYTLKKWRPASWVVSTDTGLDPDFNGLHNLCGLHRAGSAGGVFHINQSKSSMAVFLVGGGATTTKTSEPDGLTTF